MKDDAETDLAAAKPALEEALSALNSITPKDITSLKALKNPPDIVKRIFDCVLLLRYWPLDKVGGCIYGCGVSVAWSRRPQQCAAHVGRAQLQGHSNVLSCMQWEAPAIAARATVSCR